MKIASNSFVTIDYLIRVNGVDFYPGHGEPEQISFCLGFGAMPTALEDAMLGLTVQDHKVVRLTPEQAYGEVDPELVWEIPRTEFPAADDPTPGQVFETDDDDGNPLLFMVREVQGDTVVIDFNHPLAGQELEVSFTVHQVREATPEDLEKQPCQHCQTGSPHHHH